MRAPGHAGEETIDTMAMIGLADRDAPHTRPCAVFLHGIGGSARAWSPQLESFRAAGIEPLGLDLPGYAGRALHGAMDFEGLAADVEAQLAQRAIHRPVLIGHSLGGMVAQTALRRAPDGYAAVVLCCTSPAFGNATSEFQKTFVAERLEPLNSGKSMGDLAPTLVAAMMGPTPAAAGRALAIEIMSRTPASTYRAAIGCLVTFDERANLPHIRVPVLCLAGQADKNAPPQMMQRMAGKIPGARFVCLAGLGHLPNLEDPRAFDAPILDFLSSLPQPCVSPNPLPGQ
jgi:3-oxoadipate enol-lactonase